MSNESTASVAKTARGPGAQGVDGGCDDYDVVVVGAGIGGLYAIHRFRQMGLRVIGIEGAGGVGGVWYHNRYPGARVDIDSFDYCYYFSKELYQEWKWSERYATAGELLGYLNHVADRFDLRRDIELNTWVTSATWDPAADRYTVGTDTGRRIRTRFLVMATGNLSRSRDIDFPGLEDYAGEWVQASHWPEEGPKYAGRRVGVVGTGSSGVQVVTEIAKDVEELYVFQRTPNFSVPAGSLDFDQAAWERIAADVPAARDQVHDTFAASHMQRGTRPTSDYDPDELDKVMQAQWEHGGHGFAAMFTDQGRDEEANKLVAEFARSRIRSIVKDPEVAEALCPFDHPIGTRRIAVDTGYYESFNRSNVTLVNLRQEPIESFYKSGLRTAARDYELDLVIFATGFEAFVGALKEIDIRNEKGAAPTDTWGRGPRTYLGIMTQDFPNLFVLTGPGSPSVLANMTLMNEYHVDWVADLIAYMDKTGAASVVPTVDAVEAWTRHVAEVAAPMLRQQVKNYMSHVNEDGSQVFIPYIGGFGEYKRRADAIADSGYPGFRLAPAAEQR